MTRTMLLLLILCAAAFPADVNGSVEWAGEIRIVNLWGTWEEMGYAHGYLLGPDLLELYEGYFLELAGGTGNVDILRACYDSLFTVPDEFQEYAAGIIAGASDTVSLWSTVYGRELDALDICITSSVPDLSAMVDMQGPMCSSVSAWGDATMNDDTLLGSAAVSRNLDYYIDTDGLILTASCLFVFDPADGQDWISVGFPGFMGSLSGMNEAGINATLNMGNHQGTSQTSPDFVPICLALSLGLSSEDFDQNGSHDIEDIMSAATCWNRANSYDIHITVPESMAGVHAPGVVAEVNNHQGFAFRYSGDEPSIAPCRLILTNHHRILYPPVYCYRYSDLTDSLTAVPDLTLERLWDLMASVGYPPFPGSGGTIQTMIFRPEDRTLGIAFASPGVAAPDKEPCWLHWSDLYPNHEPQGTGSIPQAPLAYLCSNPVSQIISVAAPENSVIELRDISGRKVQADFALTGEHTFQADVQELPSSVYLVHVVTPAGSTVLRAMIL